MRSHRITPKRQPSQFNSAQRLPGIAIDICTAESGGFDEPGVEGDPERFENILSDTTAVATGVDGSPCDVVVLGSGMEEPDMLSERIIRVLG
jgi:hypothetical protein